MPNNIAFISGKTRTMDHATKFAQDTFIEFVKALENEDDHYVDFAVKVPFEASSSGVDVENIWVGVYSISYEEISGFVSAEPQYTDKVSKGQNVSIKTSQIVDWQYAYKGKTYGHFSTRVLLQDMEENEVSAVLNALGWETIDG